MLTILTPKLVLEALDINTPSIDTFVSRNTLWVKRSALHVCVLTDALLVERTFGAMPRSEWPRDYSHIAHGKAKLALRTRMSTARIITEAPQLLEGGDVKYRGGVYRAGFAVGTSGIQSYWDQMISNWVADTIVALSQREFEERVLVDTEKDFL